MLPSLPNRLYKDVSDWPVLTPPFSNRKLQKKMEVLTETHIVALQKTK